jgi:hypothetical protein
MDKYQEMVLNLVNGNISDYRKALKRLTKAQLVEYIRYLYDNVACDVRLEYRIFREYIENHF